MSDEFPPLDGFTEQFFPKLKEKYLELKNGDDSWTKEFPHLLKILPLLKKDIEFRYSIIRPVGVGGIGIVLEVNDDNLNSSTALKLPRPDPDKIFTFSEIVQEEIAHLLKIRHPNIIEIYYKGSLSSELGRVPYYIMELITDSKDGLGYFKEQPRTLEEILNVLKQITEGLHHLHVNNLVHLDIKLENMLISPNGRAVISDLGSTRSLIDGPDLVNFATTKVFLHPTISAHSYSSSNDPNRVKVSNYRRSDLNTVVDLYALGKNIFRIFKIHEAVKYKFVDSYSRKYLELLAARLLDGQNFPEETALGLPLNAFKEIKYKTIDEVRNDIKKMTGEYPLHRIIPEINEHGIQTIQTSSLSPTIFSPRLSNIIEHPGFRRLGDITQLGFINLIYPTATHSRLEHVLGTYTNTVRYCDALFHDPVNPLFKQIMTENDLKAVFLAALLHDIGQYPLAHDFEEADADLFSHKDLTIKILKGDIKYLDFPILKEIIREKWDVDPQKVVEIIDANPTNLNSPIKNRILHTLIDSPIDADKLDYLVRDSVNLNVPFGKAIDFERLLKVLTVIFKDQNQNLYIALGIHEKGKIPAETIAFVRYAMFGSVYWHHTSRAIKSMLHRAIWEGLLKLSPSEKKKYKDEFFTFILIGQSKQLQLFSTSKKSTFDQTQLASSDKKVIEWVADGHTTPAGFDLLELINNRHIFKRILVISRRKKPALWDNLIKFKRNNDWKMIVKLQDYIQKLIIQNIRQFDDKQRTITALNQDATEKIVTMHAEGKILFLIDIPSWKIGSRIDLEYLPESNRREMIDQWNLPVPLEDSVIWKQLNNTFLESAGKIRVFCHPEISNTITAAISQDNFEQIVEQSLRYVGTERY